MLTDVRYAARSLLRQPTFTLVAVLTLALGLGANAAIFAVVDAVVLRPLPYPRPGQLVMVWQDLRARGGPAREWATPGDFADWQSSGLFAAVAAVTGWSPTLSADDEPEQLVGAQVTQAYFDVLGIPMQIGRGFRPDEAVPHAPRVAVLTHGLWQRRFGAAPSILGRSVSIAGEPHTVVGVLPPAFRPAVIDGAQVFRPLRLDLASPPRGLVILRVVGRLAPGDGEAAVTERILGDEDAPALRRARARADVLSRELEARHPDTNRAARIHLELLRDHVTGAVRPALWALFGTVCVVLLIACANVANLYLTRALVRERELAVRKALGASRGRIVRLLMAEGALLASMGAALGLLLALWTVQALIGIAPPQLPRTEGIDVNLRVVAFTSAVGVLATMLFSLAPALRVAGGPPAALREGRRTTSGAARLRQGLVVAEVALALILLIGAGLLLRSLSQLRAVDLGFDTSPVLAGRIAPSPVKYSDAARLTALYDEVLERAKALPGVRVAALTSVMPFGGDSDVSFEIEGRPPASRSDPKPVAWYRLVSAGYFRALGLQAVHGRLLADTEAAPVLVVNETMARSYWPAADALGKRIRTNADAPWFTVVGVVADMRSRGPTRPAQVEMFIPYRFAPERPAWILLRTVEADRSAGTPQNWAAASTRGDSLAPTLAGALRRTISEIDPELPVSDVQALEARVAEQVAPERFLATLTTAFGLLALFIGACGIYGVMAYLVSTRTLELGVRTALGAEPRDLFALVVGHGLRTTAVGIACGLAGAAIGGRWVRSLLFETRPTDVTALVLAVAVLGAAAVAACYVPARRAMRVEPLHALRQE